MPFVRRSTASPATTTRPTEEAITLQSKWRVESTEIELKLCLRIRIAIECTLSQVLICYSPFNSRKYLFVAAQLEETTSSNYNMSYNFN
ncbi:hypothetical protein WICANDRAFT_96122 [Wickerhamomyces anomalus NRRL Y-366-8]|uniref:Uncharacterized protein n=1 Tax=Wickerhamomyces anomalus (strain ATCC 58044 / CBS 1984 / NCYC 433 / NRRL Y-366-8) TaxID=683960 RepID=A0A1E3NZ90_WICAA|nr:uncharacterized protein WICANDRAFT_96122 [Wickerhamomyces anomalus NRRL Y-366-8]ODQ58415.1 hypothetical protein WICANDRAFT_96122 [Wickerhamomyces anomalus NRRL Y-366-8]